ncbi:MAG: hypothetical protein IKF68_00520 [Erysipelotrichaceae bacterium]|nr:hypothetical protein [Erysipelotrichaceae bacterium]
MKSAIIYLTDLNEAELSKTMIFDRYLIDYSIAELKRLDIDTIYAIGDIDTDVTVRRESLNEVFEELKGTKGKTILLSPFYPLISKEDYERLLEKEENAVFVDKDENIVPVFAIANDKLSDYDKVSYEGVEIKEENAKRFNNVKDISVFRKIIRKRINERWLDKGVILPDPDNTTIGLNVFIDRNTYVHPNTVISGRCIIGKNNVIGEGSRLNDVVIGDNNRIECSRIDNSVIHNNCYIGPDAIIFEKSELFDDVSIGSYVRINDVSIGKRSSINHLSYIGDARIGQDVVIGSGVSTVNSDRRSKQSTIIRDHSTIGSNSSLIAPLTIGEYAMIGAGSTIDSDVRDGDLAIARIYQQNKKGYGYKYNKED